MSHVLSKLDALQFLIEEIFAECDMGTACRMLQRAFAQYNGGFEGALEDLPAEAKDVPYIDQEKMKKDKKRLEELLLQHGTANGDDGDATEAPVQKEFGSDFVIEAVRCVINQIFDAKKNDSKSAGLIVDKALKRWDEGLNKDLDNLLKDMPTEDIDIPESEIDRIKEEWIDLEMAFWELQNEHVNGENGDASVAN